MLSSGKKKSSSIDEHLQLRESEELNGRGGSGRGTLAPNNGNKFVAGRQTGRSARDTRKEERQHFLPSKSSSKRKAKLAKEESIEEGEEESGERCGGGRCCWPCLTMLLGRMLRKRYLILVLLICCAAAIYCSPFVEIDVRIPSQLPNIPFNFRDGPLKPSSASSFKYKSLFKDQISGPESVAIDSMGNMYLAIEGGFILYAHLNKSAPLTPSKRSYYDNSPKFGPLVDSSNLAAAANSLNINDTDLVKIAELNPIKQVPNDRRRRESRSDPSMIWRRECLIDENIYGSQLYSGGSMQPLTVANEIDGNPLLLAEKRKVKKFTTNVVLSRCSKPLGVRLSPDERHLYVIDSLNGLYRVNLKVADKPYSTQRLVTKLVDFRIKNRGQLLPVISLDLSSGQQHASPIMPEPEPESDNQIAVVRARNFINVSLVAVDDLAIDYGAGTHGEDLIYMSVGSQNWMAISYFFDLFEGKPSGCIIRYDTGTSQLSVLNPSRVAHVRYSSRDMSNQSSLSRIHYSTTTTTTTTTINGNSAIPYMGIGAPFLDENDVFDDRPLHFPNGLELTDDRQALLIADTSNKRIIKHYIRGSRKGTSDLWAWTPNFPDNIRRGSDRRHETYWVVGCGQDMTDKFDTVSWLNSWPRLRKYILKNLYLFGWIVEMVGVHIAKSTNIIDFGYSIKTGHSITERICPGMMILQYNRYGDVIRSIHSKEFPNDLSYFSQVNELFDTKNQEHILYLSSPIYKYVTKLTLPTDSPDLPSDVR